MIHTDIFRKTNGVTTYYDQITIGVYSFDAIIGMQERRGDPSAINCGRIVHFEMVCEDEMVAYFDEGQWYITPDMETFCPEEDEFTESVRIARDVLIRKWRNPEKVKMTNPVDTDLF